MSENALDFIKVKGRKVAVDSKGRVRLNDLHKAGNFSKNCRPTDWGALPSTLSLIIYTAEKERDSSKSSGKSGTLSKDQMNSVYCVKMGAGGGVWAHPNLALAYAKYLSPALHYEVNEVFLRYKSGDATLADEALQRSSPEGNEWAGIRAIGRAKRNRFTDTLRDHGVTRFGYAQCTDASYKVLFGARAKTLRETRQLPANANLRDHMVTDELVWVAAAETLATGRIQDEGSCGNGECAKATSRSASFIKQAIEADMADRKKKSA